MSIEQTGSNFWQNLQKSLEKIIRSIIWFCLTLTIGLIPVGIIWLREMSQGNSFTFEELMLRGDILAFSIVLISSLVWDYIIFEKKNRKENIIEQTIFYVFPLFLICFSSVAYLLCHEIPKAPELMILFEFWILALTAIYAILIKLDRFMLNS
jgi:hypothetical protein